MRKVYLLGLALLSVFAFSAMTAVPAFAESEFLVGGAGVKLGQKVHVEVVGFLLTDLKTAFGLVTEVLCSMLWEGEIDGFNDWLFLKLFDLSGKEITQATPAKEPECVNVKNCTTPEVYPVHLPWLAEVSLLNMEPTDFLVLLTTSGAGLPGWHVTCHTLGGKQEAECTGSVSGLVENLPAEKDFDVVWKLIEQETDHELGRCEEAGKVFEEAWHVDAILLVLPVEEGGVELESSVS